MVGAPGLETITTEARNPETRTELAGGFRVRELCRRPGM